MESWLAVHTRLAQGERARRAALAGGSQGALPESSSEIIMADRLFQIELAARNFRFGLEATPAEVLTWDMGAWRGPRVLVPIVVDALPVSANAATTSVWSAVAVDPLVA